MKAVPGRGRAARSRRAASPPPPDIQPAETDDRPRRDQRIALDDDRASLDDDVAEDWSLGPAAGKDADVRPVERPARAGERAAAGVLDLLVLGALAFVVVYFSGRAARVPVSGLLPVWPYLAGYVAFLGVVYAAYFTGATIRSASPPTSLASMHRRARSNPTGRGCSAIGEPWTKPAPVCASANARSQNAKSGSRAA